MGSSTTILLAFIFLLLLPLNSAGSCKKVKLVEKVNIPDDKTLLTISAFEEFIVNIAFTQLYFIPFKPVSYAPWSNFTVIFTKGSEAGKYIQNVTAKEEGVVIQPNRFFTLNSTTNRTMFLDEAGRLIPIWSSSPARYFWTLKCSKYEGQTKKTCLPKDANMSLFVNGGLSELSWYDIVLDLCDGTGVRFRADVFEWLNTREYC